MSSSEEIGRLVARLSLRDLTYHHMRAALEYFAGDHPPPPPIAFPPPDVRHQLPGVELAPVAAHLPAASWPAAAPAAPAAPLVHAQAAVVPPTLVAAAPARLPVVSQVNLSPPRAEPPLDHPPPYGPPPPQAQAPIVLASLPPQVPGARAVGILLCRGQTEKKLPCQQPRGVRDYAVQSPTGPMTVKLCASHKGKATQSTGVVIYIDENTQVRVHGAARALPLENLQAAPLIPPLSPGANTSVSAPSTSVGLVAPAAIPRVSAVPLPSSAVPLAQGSFAPIRPPPPLLPRAVGVSVEGKEEDSQEEEEKKAVHVNGDILPRTSLASILTRVL